MKSISKLFLFYVFMLSYACAQDVTCGKSEYYVSKYGRQPPSEKKIELKNPNEINDLEEMRQIALFWIDQTKNQMNVTYALMDILALHGIQPTMNQIKDAINRVENNVR